MGERLRFIAKPDGPDLEAFLGSLAGRGEALTVLCLVAESSSSAIPGIQSLAASYGLGLIGAVFPALLVEERIMHEGAYLVVLPPGAQPLLVPGLGEPEASAKAIVQGLSLPTDGTRPTLFMIFDALVPTIASILRELYAELADSVRYFGVCSGSETFAPIPCLFDGTRIIQGGMACFFLPHPTRTALVHGYEAPANSLAATATSGNRIISIDWKPAFEVYRAEVRSHFGVDLDKENFYTYAVHFPFGLTLANGHTLVRIPVALDDAGGIFCVGEVPENSVLSMLHAPAVDSVETVASLARLAKDCVGPQDALLFYCAGRRLHLGAGAERELANLASALKASLPGVLSLGEIGSFDNGGYPFFHNACLACAFWPQP